MVLIVFSLICMAVIAVCTFGAFVRWYGNQDKRYLSGLLVCVGCLVAAFAWNVLVVSPLVYA